MSLVILSAITVLLVTFDLVVVRWGHRGCSFATGTWINWPHSLRLCWRRSSHHRLVSHITRVMSHESRHTSNVT